MLSKSFSKPRPIRLSIAMGTMLFACALSPNASASTEAVAGRSTSAMGLNLSGFETYSPDIPVIDQMKKSGEWLTQCDSWVTPNCSGFTSGASSWDTKEQAKMDVDENGWLRSLPGCQ